MCVGDIPDGIWSILFKWETMLCTRPDTSEVCNQEFHLEGGESLGKCSIQIQVWGKHFQGSSHLVLTTSLEQNGSKR
jgi:homoserine acetyltransferase